MAVLQVVKGNVPGQILELRGARTIFGRHPNCQIVLDDAAVSRHHAQILESHGNFYLEDLSSRNGTHLNDVRIEGRTELHDGDEISVCDLVFQFHLKPPPAPTPLPKSSQTDSSRFEGSWVRTRTDSGGSKHFVIEEGSAESQEDGSSIITTLNVESSGSSSSVRFGVKPEVKLEAILEISNSLADVLNLDDVLERILEVLMRIYPQCDEGFVLLENPQSNDLVVRAIKTRKERDADDLPISMTIVRQAMESQQAILSANAADDVRFKTSDSLTGLQLRSVMCVPLISKKTRRALGVIQIAARSLGARFSQKDLDLLISVASQGVLAIDNARLYEAEIKQRDLERDLEYAMQIQLGFLPNERPKIDRYEFGNYYEAAQSVGGDYFDYVPLADGRIAVLLGDVAGKGVPAALLMARLFSMARSHLLSRSTAGGAMTDLNRELTTSGMGHRFITCVAAILDPARNEVSVANAGHMPPLIRRADGTIDTLPRTASGLPLGVFEDQVYGEKSVELGKDELMLLYTDGVTEAMNPKNRIFGRERLVKSIKSSPPDVTALLDRIIADIEEFASGRPQSDDTCLVCVKRVE